MRRTRLYSFGIAVPLLDLVTQVLLVVLGFLLVFSGRALTRGLSLGTSPTWHELAFALPLAMLAYTGLETVANYAEEARRPGRDVPRSLFGSIGSVILVYVLIALIGLSAFPASHGTTALGSEWVRSPIMGIVSAVQAHVSHGFGQALRVYVGLTGALVLFAAATTSISGFARLAHSLGEHGQLPRAFGRLNRRTLVSPAAVVAASGISIGFIIATSFSSRGVTFLASLFSFGVLLAFTAAQLAVIRLRVTAPELTRPFRVPLGVRVRGVAIPLPSVLGALATGAVFVAAMATHVGARYGGPAWLLAGVVLYLVVRRRSGTGLLERVSPSADYDLPQAEFSRILVPMKLGPIGEEMVAGAIRLAQERNATIEALFVVRVPLDLPLDAALPEIEAQAAESIAGAQALGVANGVPVAGRIVRSRSIGDAIVEAAAETGVDLIVLGSSPRWRRQSRFFSPTVEYVLRRASAEVLIVAFPTASLQTAPTMTGRATLHRP